MKKRILLTLFAFVAGFLTHALVFPDLLANGFTDIQQIAIPQPTSTTTKQNEPLVTTITYDGKQFSRHNVTVEFSRYIEIMNESKDTQMKLISNYPDLNTERGYSESEVIKARMEKRGQFVVADKNNPSERLVITVK